MSVKNEMNGAKNQADERLELLLRSQRPLELSEGFRRGVMTRIAHLPAPRYADLPQGRFDFAWLLRQLGLMEKSVLALTALLLVAICIPGVSETLGGWQLELGTQSLSLSVGESAASASLLSIAAILACLGFVGALGMFAARNKLISA